MSGPKRKPLPASAIEDARRVAAEQIANRTRRDEIYRCWRAVDEAFVALSSFYAEQIEAEDGASYEESSPQRQLGFDLHMEASRLRSELAPYLDGFRGTPSWRECALDGEEDDAAQIRVLLERGASSYQFGARDRQARRHKKKRRERLSPEVGAAKARLAASKARATNGSGFAKLLASPPNVHPLELWIAEASARIDRLASDEKFPTTKRRKRRG